MKRILPFFLFLLCFIPVSAAEVTPVDVLYDTASVSRWDAYFGGKPFGDLSASEAWQLLDGPVRVAGIGAMDSHATLERRLLNFERKYAEVRNGILQTFVNLILDVDAIRAEIEYDASLGVYRLIDSRSGIWIVSLDGSFPYYRPGSSVDPDTGETSVSLGGQWIPYSQVDWAKTNVLTEYSLYDLGYDLRDIGQDNDVVDYKRDGDPFYKYIRSAWTVGNFGDYYVYCDSSGNPYVSRVDADAWAQDDKNDYYVDGDDGETSNGQLIDVDTNTVWFPDGTLNFINNLVYDESQKTYYVDASSSYDIDNNYYYTYNYHYEYHIDYTSITYIGQTEEYNEVYEYYYQLPDGRSSADLTAEELQALNTQIDVLPYIRSADDTSIRALYHFDGDTRDSSYWSHLGEFKWNKGGTLTYMDVGAFNGALYLNENEHDFEITLPSNLGSADFTIQFRIYQSATLAAAGDTYVTIGDAKIIQNNGNVWYYNNDTVVGQASPGTWNEICLMRKDSVLYYFQNGVFTKSIPLSTILGDTIRFVFGNKQQTYKYFDEFRVVNEAIYPVTGYTPTSVPHDTNLALVLPDSQLPVADEYWSFKSSYENLLAAHGLDHAADISADSDIYFANSSYSLFEYGKHSWYNPGGDWDIERSAQSSWVGANKLAYLNRAYLDFVVDGSFARFEHTSRVTNPDRLRYMSKYETASTAFEYPANAFVIPILYSVDQTQSSIIGSLSPNYFITSGDVFTFSMVASDGTVGSFTFDCSADRDTFYYFNGYTFRLYRGLRVDMTSDVVSLVTLSIYPTEVGAGGDFVYLELVDGDSTDLTAEFVSSVVAMDKEDLNTPSLAVRTDIDITGYQIGGVRPSLPTKGLVWALVEDSRITSLQIYNGQAWEEVDGRIWTGSRWVPYYAYDVLLLKDMWDIVEADPSLNPIYTEAGFWKWLQEAWGEMMAKLDQIIVALGGKPSSGEECLHTYESKIAREATCSEPGHMTYTCTQCGHSYTELIDAHGHDWTVVNSVPDVLDENGSVIEEGYEELVCTVCDTQSRDYGEGPEEVEFFDAVGDFIADGITWILDKLEELADSLRGITEIFNSFRDRISGMAGGFPLFFAGIVALLPEDLMVIFWFAVIGWIVLKVWKKWSN